MITAEPGAPAEDRSAPQPELTQEEAIATTEKLAMDEDRFWALIDVMGGAATEASVERLVDELARLNEDELIAFEATFTLKAFALDTLETAQWYMTHDPISVELDYFSYDAFYYERCGTVGAGRARYERAVETSRLVLDETEGERGSDLAVGRYQSAEIRDDTPGRPPPARRVVADLRGLVPTNGEGPHPERDAALCATEASDREVQLGLRI